MRKQFFTILGLSAAFIMVVGLLPASAQNVCNYKEQGGKRTVIGCSLDVKSGGEIDIEAGGSLKIAGTQITASGIELNYTDITTLGTVQASKALTVDADKRLIWTTTSSGTVNPISFTSTMTGPGTTGGRALFRLNIEAALGDWSNALKAYASYNASGSTSGLGSALVAEIALSTGTVTGTYAPLESEIVVGSNGSLGTATSFLYMNVVDDGTTFQDGGYLFELGAAIVDTNNGLFDVISVADVDAEAALKIRIGGVDYFIPLNTNIDFTN